MVPRIRQIQIQNYKSIERAVVDLEPFTVFVGPNGAGKSNFVDVLPLVRDCLSESAEQAFRKRAASNALPRWGELYGKLAVRLLVDLADGLEAEYAFQVEWAFRGGFRVLHEKCTIKGEEEIGFEVAEGQFVRPIPGIRPQLFPDRLALAAASATEEFRPIYDFLTGIRIYSINPSNPYLFFGQESDPGEDLQPDGVNATAVLRSLEEHAPEVSARVSRLLSRIVEGLKGVSTDTTSGRVFLKFSQDIGEDRPAVFFDSEVSEGTLRVLCLLLAIYQPRRPSVLIIEEPEAKVHPAAAEVVVQVLLDAAQDRQVLITTHSPDILDAKELSDSQIRVVTMEKGRTIIAPLSSASRQAIRERLYTPGELLRIDELSQDVEAAQNAAQALDLFTEAPSGS